MEMMKKTIAGLLVVCVLLSGCAKLNSWINPLSDEGEQVSADFQPNPFLWQAAKDKLQFMTIASEDKESGTITTNWSRVDQVAGEEFKVVAKVLSTELRSDCLQVEVSKRRLEGGRWVNLPTNHVLDLEMETAILKQARVLYQNSLATNKN